MKKLIARRRYKCNICQRIFKKVKLSKSAHNMELHTCPPTEKDIVLLQLTVNYIPIDQYDPHSIVKMRKEGIIK